MNQGSAPLLSFVLTLDISATLDATTAPDNESTVTISMVGLWMFTCLCALEHCSDVTKSELVALDLLVSSIGTADWRIALVAGAATNVQRDVARVRLRVVVATTGALD